MAEIIRPPEFNRPNLKSLIELAESTYTEFGIVPPDKVITSEINFELVKDERPDRVARFLEHHIQLFRRTVEANPEMAKEISERSSMLWLYLNRAKSILSEEG